MSFREVTENGLGDSERGHYFQAVATVLLVRSENCVYKACPSEECNKKVVDMENGMYRCEKCNRDYPNFKYRLLASVRYQNNRKYFCLSNFCLNIDEFSRLEWQSMGECIRS